MTREGRLLLVRRAHEPWRGSWDIPGGFCGPREHPADAAVREVKEETGLDVSTTGILGLWIDTYAPSGPDADKVTLNAYFHAEPVSKAEPRLDPTEVAEIAERDMDPANAWQVGMDDNGDLFWESDEGIVNRQPAQNGWQRFQMWIFGIAPEGQL